MLSISHSRWSGIGNGHGHLAAREATVTVSTRTTARPRSARLWLPGPTGQISRADGQLWQGGGPVAVPDLREVLAG